MLDCLAAEGVAPASCASSWPAGSVTVVVDVGSDDVDVGAGAVTEDGPAVGSPAAPAAATASLFFFFFPPPYTLVPAI